MQIWQKAMIGLARNRRVTVFMHRAAWMQAFSKRFVGGRGIDEVLATVVALQDRHCLASLFFLGEYVESEELVDEAMCTLEAAVQALGRAGLPLHVSVDPTQVGAMLSWELCRKNIVHLAEAMASAQPAEQALQGCDRPVLMLDMEDSGVTQQTLELYHLLRDRDLPAAVTVQAYLYRSTRDLERLVKRGAFVRLVKGAFAEPADIAHTTVQGRDRAFREALEVLFSQEARSKGVSPVVASHDHRMIEYAASLADANNWGSSEWEVEMLYGVRPQLQRRLLDAGHRLRVYMPFGSQWWPYSIRRIGETPRNLGFVLRAMASRP